MEFWKDLFEIEVEYESKMYKAKAIKCEGATNPENNKASDSLNYVGNNIDSLVAPGAYQPKWQMGLSYLQTCTSDSTTPFSTVGHNTIQCTPMNYLPRSL